MSLTLLLEKYDVSTEEGLQKALNDIEKEECEVNEALSNALSRACTLEGRLRSASQAYTKLSEVKSDAQVAADMVDKTAVLARDVSAKVRQLDLARSRVAECQRRVHDLIDLRVCSAGVEAAIKAHDYETGAGHVARFLSMSPGSVAAAAPDPRADMAAAARTLREHLLRKFEEASRKEDDAAVERLYRLFPQIGCADEGLDLLAKYIAKQTEASIRRAGVISSGETQAAIYADALTRVLEAGAAALDRVRGLALAAPAPPAPRAPALPRALRFLQPVISAGAGRVCAELMKARRPALEAGPGPHGPHGQDGRGALAAEPGLNELALTLSRLQMYFAFLRRRAEMDGANLDEKSKADLIDATEKIIGECELTRITQDVLTLYLTLERYFLEESVNKALKLSTQAGATGSSLIDDVFFIARKVIRRGVSTGSVDGACAALNEAGAQLERVAGAARRRLAAPPAAPLALRPPPAPPAPAALQPPALLPLAARLNRDLDHQRTLYLACMNEAECGAEWSERLAEEGWRGAGAVCRAGGERDKVRGCVEGLAAAAAAFRAAHDLALHAVRAALQPQLADWADAIVHPDLAFSSVGVEEEEEAEALPAALDALAEDARAALPRAADTLLAHVVADLAARAHAQLLLHRYRREGGLRVERRVRRVAAWAGVNAGGAREKCAALAQAAALLALDSVAHAPDALAPTPRLAPAHVRDVLARRTDFKMEDIKRLKL